jgi:hypothetical protein
MAKWSIEKRVALCGKCESEFSEGAPLYSLLVTEGDLLQRLDLCAQCRSDEACAAALFWWRTKFQAKKTRGLQLDLEAIEALFIALGGSDRERLKELRYLMCLILLRKRRVKVTKVARDHDGVEGEFFIVKRPRRDEEFAVQVFDFDAAKIDSLREDLKNIFEGADPNELGADDPVLAPQAEAGSDPEVDANPQQVEGEVNPSESEVAPASESSTGEVAAEGSSEDGSPR